MDSTCKMQSDRGRELKLNVKKNAYISTSMSLNPMLQKIQSKGHGLEVKRQVTPRSTV